MGGTCVRWCVSTTKVTIFAFYFIYITHAAETATPLLCASSPKQRSLRPQRARQICVLSNLSGDSASANFGEQSTATIIVHVSCALCFGPSSSFICSHGLCCAVSGWDGCGWDGYTAKAQHRNWGHVLWQNRYLRLVGGWLFCLYSMSLTLGLDDVQVKGWGLIVVGGI